MDVSSWKQCFLRTVAAQAANNDSAREAELSTLVDMAADPAIARRMMRHADVLAQHAPEAFWAAQLTLKGGLN